MPKNLYKSIPSGYAVCLHSECPKAAECLHNIAYRELLKDQERLSLINPEFCKPESECQFFRDCTLVRYARGFTSFQHRMYPDQYDKFKSILQHRFGRTPYYERRRGNIALPPAEQDLILGVLKKVGVTELMEFDSYEDAVNWYD